MEESAALLPAACPGSGVLCALRPAASVAVRHGFASLPIGKPRISSRGRGGVLGLDENSPGPLQPRASSPAPCGAVAAASAPLLSPRRVRCVGARRGGGSPVPGPQGSAGAFAPPGRWERAARTPPAVSGLRSAAPPRARRCRTGWDVRGAMAGAARDTPAGEQKGYRLSVCSKLCYAIGGAPNQVAGSAASFFLQIYLLDIAHITPFHASLVLFIGKASGAVTDPVAGFFISKSRWTKIGRLMPWVLACTPFTIVSYFFMWYPPPFVSGRVAWYLTFHCLFQALTTLFQVPYSALTMFLSTDQKDRDSATAYRMTMEVLGTLIGAALQGQIVASAHVSPHCTVNPSVNTTDSWNDTPSIPDPSDPLSHQWMIPFAVMLVTIPNLILAYFVAFISGLSIAASLLLPWSMLPDVVDNFRLQNPHGKGHETIFYSSYVFFTKMSAGIGLGISAAGLEFTGYKPGICRQSDDVILTLKLLIGAVPAILILLGLFILLFYPITEESRKETKLALEELRRSHQSTENLDSHKKDTSV
ncbi:major facilitator superfamily domain-containing protein 2B isoform X2 [Parus major]|uniref:major facilitator superfamily domain-containing protein 2B isoform X2 n=1 Tax=Parus major TaxID=9157 RepID=UPI0007711833|nr:major facilitator superfamily domain-containing protein 2B isoform X2 [Parus major]